MKKSSSIANALGNGAVDKRIEVLRLIEKTGSISQAGRDAKISYKAAWQAIDTLTNLAGVSLVERAVGGVGGGGAHLTEAGTQLLATADLLDQSRQELLSQLQGRNPELVGATISRLSIRTSMRNHLPCHVQALQWNGQIVRVFLQLPGDAVLVARITRASAELLALETGRPVLALCKATAVQVGRTADFQEATGTNLLHGRAVRISRGTQEEEIFMGLDSDLQLVGFAPAEKAIRARSRLIAAIDETAVVVALA